MKSETTVRESERCQATVLFADISGFMAISEKLDPEEVTGFINGCFERLEAVVLAHGGIVHKYIGDCVMAVFGLTPLSDNPTEQAVRAALGIREALYQFNRDVRPPSPLDVHIGIDSGPVIAGLMGGEAKRAFTVIGDAVNFASYLEHASEKGQIYVGPETYRLTKHQFEYRPRPPARFADGRDPLPIFELVAVKATRRVKRDSERRQATVLFADILGFRALSERLDPEALTQVMNGCLAMLAEVVVGRGGVVDKFIGECVMALFGVPNAIENAPQQALNAAIEMRNRLAQFNEEHHLPVALQVHIGINTGLVIAGDIGGRVKRDFTVMGDTVNLAARLKEVALPGAIYVGPETHRYTKDDFEYHALAPVKIKGKEQPVSTYELRSVTGQVHRTRAERADRMVYSELVGRDRELAQITAQIETVVKGRGGILTLVGEAGLGKSRLMMEALAAIEDVDATFLKARSQSVGQSLSFHPFIDLWRRWAGIADEDDDAQAAARLQSALAELMPDEVGEVLPFVATLMGIRLSGAHAARIEGIEGEALEKLIVKSTRALFQRLAAVRPVVLLLEDLHWADLSSIKLLESLLPLAVDQRMLFILMFRPDYRDTGDHILELVRGQYAPQHVDIELKPLDDTACSQLIENLLRIDDLPHSTRALIARKAEGNPFYIEEVVRSLIDQAAVEYRDGRMRVTEKIDTVVIPGTIQEVIMARVDQLDETKRRLLQLGSVIGRSFYYRLIAAVVEGEGMVAADLDAELAYLKERQLLFERRTRRTGAARRRNLLDELEYVFQNALVQETIYESILQKTRKALHLKVAETIESIFFYRIADFYGMLAYHYSRAERLEKAEEYLFKAGDEAARSAASSEALTFFREASQLYFLLHGDGGDPRKKALLEKNIGLALLNKGDHTESIEHFDQAMRHLGEPVPTRPLAVGARFAVDLPAVLFQVYFRSATHGSRRNLDLDHEREVLELFFHRGHAEVTSDPQRLFFELFMGLHRLTRIDPRQVDQACGMYVSCAGIFAYSGISFAISERMLGVAKTLVREGNIRDLFVYRTMEFTHHYLRGAWEEEHVIDDDLVEQALRYGQVWDVTLYIGIECDRRLRRGDFATARRLLDKLADIKDTYGYAYAGSNHNGMRVILLLEERRLEEALRAAEQHYAASHEGTLKVMTLAMGAEVRVLLGDRGGAAAALSRAADTIKRAGVVSPWHQCGYHVAQLLFDVTALEECAQRGEHARWGQLRRAAVRSARRAQRTAAKVAKQRTEIYNLTGRLWWTVGKRRRALGWWAKSIATGERMGARPELARTYFEIGRHLSSSGSGLRLKELDAAQYLEKARQIFSELELAWDLEQLEGIAPSAPQPLRQASGG